MPALLPDGTWVSDDGRWRLLAGRWHAVPPAAPGRPGLFWFLSTPGWFVPALVAGAIALIPVAGFMNLYGWSLATASNLRLGYRVPAPADFGWIGRGARYVAWSLVVGLSVFLLTGAIATGAGALTFAARHDWAWTVAIAVATWWTVYAAFSLCLAPLLVPVLDLIDREGLAAAFAPRRVLAALRARWDVAWYGTGAILVWGLAYAACSSIGNLIPLVGPLAGLALSVPAYGVLGLMLAAPLARAGDPRATFDRGLTWLVAGLYAAGLLLVVTLVWAGAIFLGNLVSSHPEETRCFFETGCDFSYSGSRETITRVTRDPGDSSLVRVESTLINGDSAPAEVNADDYWASPVSDPAVHIPPTSDCPLPASNPVPAHSRVVQRLCFRVPGLQSLYVHLPWTGLDTKTT